MKLPSDEHLGIAILWLRNNEGGGVEGEACRAVADWLERQQSENKLRDAAREAGVPVAMVRKALARRLEKTK